MKKKKHKKKMESKITIRKNMREKKSNSTT